MVDFTPDQKLKLVASLKSKDDLISQYTPLNNESGFTPNITSRNTWFGSLLGLQAQGEGGDRRRGN